MNERNGNRFLSRVSGFALAAALGGALVLPFVSNEASVVAPANAQSASVQAPAAPFSFADVVEKVAPAVVSVVVKAQAEQVASRFPDMGDLPEDHPFRRFFKEFEDRFGNKGENDQKQRPRRFATAQGSGFFISADGYVVTNNHVVSNANEVSVRMSDGEEHEARVIGADPKTDLALLKIDGRDDFPFVRFATQDVRVGDWVIAVGNPFGLGGTVTAGIISARGRDIGAGPYDDFLQIDAPVNRGNSGGPAFNLNGEVIGINTAIFSPSGGNVGIAFAIPSSTAKDIITDLQTNGAVARGWLGVQIQAVTGEIADSVGLKDAKGAIIARILDNGPAADSDLKIGDIITSVDGGAIKDSRDLVRMIGALDPDHETKLTIWRDGGEKTVSIKLGRQPADETIASVETPQGKPAKAELEKSLGLAIQPAEDGKGVVVTAVDPDGGAAEKGVSEGDVILQINGQEVASVADVSAAVEAARKDGRKAVLALVQGESGQRFIPLGIDG
ncbi:MAG: Do family serine endopeptidase [Rhodobiaceae bacterium]|nr:Do family serine endopeptidase [Rhodobiaceae bacterium]MCC0041146.1 Do family serine endopeptidase [Rhodobiaceae bacterium]